ncbi:hypothetical protein [Actinokineospora sp. NPDC004072]
MAMPPAVDLDELPELANLDMTGWHSLPGPVLILYRLWPEDSVDTLLVHSRTNAHGERVNGEGAPVWRCDATLAAVVSALLAVPAPGHPDAPATPLDANPNIDRM